MATGTGEKLSFLRNNERVIAITESTKLHYEGCVNDLNRTHNQSDRLRKEELCVTINNLIRQIGHEERLELHLQDSDWRFTLVKVEVIPQPEEEEANENNDFHSWSPSPPPRSPLPQPRLPSPPPRSPSPPTRSPSPQPLHSPIARRSSPPYDLRPRRGRPSYREVGQSSQSQSTRRRRRPPPTTATGALSSTRLSRRIAGATNSPLVPPVATRRIPPVRSTEASSEEGNESNDDRSMMPPSPPPLRTPITHPSSSVSPHSRRYTATGSFLMGENSNTRRTCEDIRSEIVQIEGGLNDMLLTLEKEKKRIFLSRNDWRSMVFVAAAIQVVFSEVPLSVNPLCLQQFQSQLDEQVGKLLNTEMHFELTDDLFYSLQSFFDRNSGELLLEGSSASFYVCGKEDSSILTPNAEDVVRKIVEANSHKERLVKELDEMENRD